MFAKATLEYWETLVQKQLKTEDIYSILSKDNLEGLTVKPYYDSLDVSLRNLPRVESSVLLISPYQECLPEDVYAVLIDKEIPCCSEDTTFFVSGSDLAKRLSYDIQPKCISLIDVFSENTAEIDANLAKQLLRKEFKRNIAIDISVLQNSGASIIQQVGLGLAKVKELVEQFGVEILLRLIFKVAVGRNYFFEIAKIRALKLVFHQLCKEWDIEGLPYIYAEPSLRNKTVNDPENNLIRSTVELASAMIGGADALFSNDYKINESDVLSKEIAFKQQIILAYESLVNVFQDATNGSYYVEALTQEIASKSWQYFLEIESQGGYIENLKNQNIPEAIYRQAMTEQQWVEEGKIRLIGVNMYPALEKKKTAQQLYSENQIKPVRLSEMYE